MLSFIQATEMLSLQSGMNSKVDQNWLVARYPYLRAVIVEGAEAIEHHGWKWWKHQIMDRAQLQMELIDIWHFILSALLVDCEGDNANAWQRLLRERHSTGNEIDFDGRNYRLTEVDLLGKLELLIGTSVSRRIELKLFEAILADCNMSWDELYGQYVGKNVLNFFRQDKGYKQGNYQKIWHGREDNEHLVDILAALDPQHSDFKNQIYQALALRYPS
jgi:dimeric dUTPase (all-alpha-NTP-PPase superfamily)